MDKPHKKLKVWQDSMEKNFLGIAQGSLSELDTQLELCVLLEFLEQENLGELQEKLNKVDKMLSGLIRSL